MKNRTLLLAITVVALTFTQTRLFAADEDDDSHEHKKKVPPGLQKKGGLPPGQAKKQAKEAARTNTSAPAPASTPAAPAAPSATPTASKPVEVAKPATPTAPEPPKTPEAPKAPEVAKPAEVSKPEPKVSQEVLARRAALERHVADLDTMSQKPEVRERMTVRLYRRLDVPLATLEAEQKSYPNVGMGGLVVAHYIAKNSKQPTDKILAEHKAGKGWGEIANAHKVPLKDLIERMQDAKEAGREAQRESAKR